jgi:tetratricopeptide (TPR) repeat protein
VTECELVEIPQETFEKIFATQPKWLENVSVFFEGMVVLDPNDLEAQINEANCYYHTNDLTTYKSKITSILDKNPNNATLQYNVGFLMISDDAKIVDEINANLKDDKKYKELMSKRKDMFKAALPYFEKAYQLDVNNPDTKEILKLSYDILGMKDKAATIK